MNQLAMPSAPSLMTSPVWSLKTSMPFTFTRSLPSGSAIRSTSGSPKMTNRLPLPVLREGFLLVVIGSSLRDGVNQLVGLIHAQHAVRTEALHGEGTGHADFLVVQVGLVVEVFELGLCRNGGVNLLLPGDSGRPPFGMQLLRGLRPRAADLTRNLPLHQEVFFDRMRRTGRINRTGSIVCPILSILYILPSCPKALESCMRSDSSVACHFSQITSNSALLAMDLWETCGTRL
jgi:hypothetical protein